MVQELFITCIDLKAFANSHIYFTEPILVNKRPNCLATSRLYFDSQSVLVIKIQEGKLTVSIYLFVRLAEAELCILWPTFYLLSFHDYELLSSRGTACHNE